MGILISIGQFLLGLSLLILLHEAGHFFAARLFKIRVEKFYLFFDPWFELFKIKRGDTEYGIGWLPLGGYVKISGMIDESMDKEQMKLPPEPWEFRSKPGWQRVIVMLAGVTVNFVLGIIIFSALTFTNGTSYLPIKNAKYGIYCDSLATKVGLKSTDLIVSVDHKPVLRFDSITMDIIFNKAKSIEVQRDGKLVSVPISADDLSKILADAKGFISPLVPFSVDSVVAGLGAYKAGIKKGDSITKVDTINTPYFQTITTTLQKYIGKTVTLQVKTNGQIHYVQAHVSDKDTLGFPAGSLGFAANADTLRHVYASYTFLQSIPAGINMAFGVVSSFAKQLSVMFTVKDAHKQVGSFITFAKVYGPVWNWTHFWSFTAFISIMLAFVNVLPVPALDGGHVMFLLYEMITGRKPNEKVMEYAQWVGMLLLLTVIVYANGMDISRLFHK
jgi:regulator of sigma E protease